MADVSSVYLVQAASEATLPESSQLGIVAYADRHGDTTILEVLAARPDLAPPVRDLLSSRPDAGIRAAYLSRGDLTRAERELALTSETRAGVLAAVLAAPVMQTEAAVSGIEAHLAGILAKNPTKTLAEAVVAHPALSVATRVAAIEVLSTFPSIPVPVLVAIRETLTQARRDEALALRAAVAVGAVAGMRTDALALNGLDSVTRIEMLRAELADTSGQLRAHRALAAVDVMLDEVDDLQPEVLAVMHDAVVTSARLRPKLAANMLARLGSYSMDDRMAQRDRVAHALTAARTAATLDEITGAVALTVELDRPDVAQALVTNPAFGTYAGDLTPVLQVLTPTMLVDTVRARDDERWSLAAYLADPAAMIDADGWSAFADATPAQVTVARSLRRTWDQPAGTMLQPLLIFAASGVATEALLELPWGLFTEVASSYHAESQGGWIASALSAAQSRLSGAAQWETLEMLGEEFNGSLAELVNAANML